MVAVLSQTAKHGLLFCTLPWF